MPPVYALDFDGVVCDSAAETAIAGVLAAAQLWKTPELTAAAKDARTGGAPAWLTDALRAARPVVETGYEVVLMARALCEAGATDAPALAQRILSGWPPMRDVYMADWDVTKEVLVENFGEVRDAWIRDDLSSWVAANHFFPGVADAINFAAGSVYIITTKQRRFCELLLKSNGVNLPSERIFPHGSGSKVTTLKKLLESEPKGDAIIFVEDRYETLEVASLTLLGTRVELFLADWGYNTPVSRAECADHPLIGLLDLHAFVTRFE